MNTADRTSYIRAELAGFEDPVRDAMLHGEAAPAEFAAWPHHECLRRLRMRMGLKRYQLAAKAGVSPSLVGRAEKGADLRLNTLARLYEAMGCRLLLLPAGASYDMDWDEAYRDDEFFDWRRANARHLTGPNWAAPRNSSRNE